LSNDLKTVLVTAKLYSIKYIDGAGSVSFYRFFEDKYLNKLEEIGSLFLIEALDYSTGYEPIFSHYALHETK
jgi:hypothetical protein